MENDKYNGLTFIDFLAVIVRYWVLIVAVTFIGTITFTFFCAKEYYINKQNTNNQNTNNQNTITDAKYKILYTMSLSNEAPLNTEANYKMGVEAIWYLKNLKTVSSLLEKYPTIFDVSLFKGKYPNLNDDIYYQTVIQNEFLETEYYQPSLSRMIFLWLTTPDYIAGTDFLKEISLDCNSYLNTAYRTENFQYLIPQNDPQVTLIIDEPIDPIITIPNKSDYTKKVIIVFVALLLTSVILALFLDYLRRLSKDVDIHAKLSDAWHHR